MGSGVSMSSIINGKNVTRNPEKPRELLLPLEGVGEHLRVFQHRFTGDAIVLIDQDPSQILTDYIDWHEVHVSSQQSDYFQRMRVTVSAKDCLKVDFSAMDDNEEEKSLVPTTNTPAISYNNSSPRSDDARREIKSQLPPIVKKNSDRRARVKKSTDIKLIPNDGELPLRVNPALVPKTLPGISSREPETHNISPTDENPIVPKFPIVKPLVLPVLKESKSTPLLAVNTNTLSLRLAPIDSAQTQFHSGQDLNEPSISNNSSNQVESARISYAASESTAKAGVGAIGAAGSCHICGTKFDSFANVDEVEGHIMNCRDKVELKKCFQEIDESLLPILGQLKEAVRKTIPSSMSSDVDKAKPDIDVEKLITGVMSINVDNAEAPKINVLLHDLDMGIEVLNELSSAAAPDNYSVAKGSARAAGSGSVVAALRRRALAFNPDQLSFLLLILTDTKAKLNEKRVALQKYGRCYNTYPSDFKLLKGIGKGGFSKVYLARRLDSGKTFAIKVMTKKQVREEKKQQQVLRERIAMTHASKEGAEYFVKLHCAFQNSLHLFFVMEYIPCGDCLSLLMAVKKIHEHVAQHIVAQVSLAVQHLHSHGVVHRDIKPDNILITDRGHVKLGDFGLVSPFNKDMISTTSTRESNSAVHQAMAAFSNASASSHMSVHNHIPSLNLGPNLPPTPTSHRPAMRQKSKARGISLSDSLWLDDTDRGDSNGEPRITVQDWDTPTSSSESESICMQRPVEKNKLNSRVGNYIYACPEIVIGSGYDHTVDWWAVGVLLFHFVAGVTPFESPTGQKDDTLENIIFTKINWDVLPSDISVECKDLISRHLQQAPESRLGFYSSQDVLNHSFFHCLDLTKLYQNVGPLYPMIMDQAGRPLPLMADGLSSMGRNSLSEGDAMDLPHFEDDAEDLGDAPSDFSRFDHNTIAF